MNYQALTDEFGFDTGIGILHLEACDCKPAAQRVLSTLSLDHGAGVTRTIQHVGSNIMHRIPKAAQRMMEELFPKMPPMALKASGGPDEHALNLQLKRAREILEDPVVFHDGATAWCVKCQKNCELWGHAKQDAAYSQCEDAAYSQCEDAAYSQCETELFIAGFTCKDWSRQGTRMGCGGASMAPFLVMVFELRARKPRIAILECTPGQPDNLVVALLEDLYFIDSVVLCPLEKGWPNRRPRKWPLSSTSRCYIRRFCIDHEYLASET